MTTTQLHIHTATPAIITTTSTSNIKQTPFSDTVSVNTDNSNKNKNIQRLKCKNLGSNSSNQYDPVRYIQTQDGGFRLGKLVKTILNQTNNKEVLVILTFLTSAKAVMFSPGFVCGFVSLFVNKITQKRMDGF